jgi:hypothetical protein
VVTTFWPRNLLPSLPSAGLEKNWTAKVLVGVLFSLPVRIVLFNPAT